MPPEAEEVRSCAACGASIYPEHITRHAAGVVDGKLLCMHCRQEAESRAAHAPHASHPAHAVAAAASPAPMGTPAVHPPDGGEEPAILLADGEAHAAAELKSQRVYGGGGITFDRDTHSDEKLRRPLLKGASATRCRTFHCKLNDPSIIHMNDQVNHWTDEHQDVEIKFAVCAVGVIEGKHADPHLIVTVFY
ncbi:hypothetical protein RAS1_43300 [Phycisphaerae bacterium RAS1]|nr:hypothetical protein RAS1_43300 [Phycisphaerae bacterium RAS1]